MLFEWQKKQGANSMMWYEGESGVRRNVQEGVSPTDPQQPSVPHHSGLVRVGPIRQCAAELPHYLAIEVVAFANL
jgi:hypothetical protein